MAECKWRWERVDPASTGASGDIAKLFKNDLVKVPGLLAAKDAPSSEAVLMAREVVQNSWDAAREARDAIGVNTSPYAALHNAQAATHNAGAATTRHQATTGGGALWLTVFAECPV